MASPKRTQKTLFDSFKQLKRSGNFRNKIKRRVDKLFEEEKSAVSVKMNQTMTIISNRATQNVPFKTPSNPVSANANHSLIENQTQIECDERDDMCDDYLSHDWIDIENDDGMESESDINNIVGSSLETINEQFRNLYGDKFRENLTEWAVLAKPTKYQLKLLLSLCNEAVPFNLPIDPRTILCTPRKVDILNIGGDANNKYWHHGIKYPLQLILESIPVSELPPNLSLNINIDGLPLAKSSAAQFWPILANIHQLPHIEPIVIGIYCGPSKLNKLNY